MNKNNDDKKLLEIEIVRHNGNTFFSYSIDDRIQKMYSQISSEIRTSERWIGQKFYFCPDITENTLYKNKLNNLNLFDDYGSDIILNGKFNIAWIRTVSGSGKIKIKNSISLAEISVMIANAKTFIRDHWREQMQNFRIVATITMQIE